MYISSEKKCFFECTKKAYSNKKNIHKVYLMIIFLNHVFQMCLISRFLNYYCKKWIKYADIWHILVKDLSYFLNAEKNLYLNKKTYTAYLTSVFKSFFKMSLISTFWIIITKKWEKTTCIYISISSKKVIFLNAEKSLFE